MSVHYIYMSEGRKMMRPIATREEYMALRDSEQNRRADKQHMVQMNYSLSPSKEVLGKEVTSKITQEGLLLSRRQKFPLCNFLLMLT